MSPKRPVESLVGFLPNHDLLELDQVPHLWNINAINIDDSGTTISGWSLPHGGRLGNSGLKINGRAFPVQRDARPAAVYAELYPWHPNSAFSGLNLVVPKAQMSLQKAEELIFQSVALDRPDENRSYSLSILRADLDFQIPDAEIAARIGVGEPLHYTMFGRSIYHAFDDALRAAKGAGFEKAKRIVDWGSGSGRVARHVVRQLSPGQEFYGFDIDVAAVEWSNINIGRHFSVCGLEPPLAIDAQSVDVAFAYSVFTHMSEDAFNAWIGELARILKPDGTLIFTVLSDFAMASLSPQFPRSAHDRWISRGIYDDSGNNQLETIGVGGDFYRNTWVKRAFIDKALARVGWKRAQFLSPAHFYQDLVVARRKN